MLCGSVEVEEGGEGIEGGQEGRDGDSLHELDLVRKLACST